MDILSILALSKANKALKNGGGGGGSGETNVLVVNFDWAYGDRSATADHTVEEIDAAIETGKAVIGVMRDPNDLTNCAVLNYDNTWGNHSFNRMEIGYIGEQGNVLALTVYQFSMLSSDTATVTITNYTGLELPIE